MTGARIIKEIFKKFCNIDAQGNSVVSVMNDIIQNNDSLNMSSSGSDSNVLKVNIEIDAAKNTARLDKTFREIMEFDGLVYATPDFGDGFKPFMVATTITNIPNGQEESPPCEGYIWFTGFLLGNLEFQFVAETQDDYPVITQGDPNL